MTGIKPLLLSIIFLAFSKYTSVVFDYEAKYLVDKKTTLWSISTKYPEIIFVDNIQMKRTFLYYKGKIANIESNKAVIEYQNLEFRDDKGKSRTKLEITKADKMAVIEGFKCSKYHIDSNGRKFEVYITKKGRINNTDYINSLVGNENGKAISAGLVVRVNIYNSTQKQFNPYMILQEIAKADKKVEIDFGKLNLMLEKSAMNRQDTNHVIEENK